MSDILLLHQVSREQASIHVIISTMTYLERLQIRASQILCTHVIEFRFAKSAKKVINRLVVGVVHISRAWGKEIYEMFSVTSQMI
jgi:hypothetical protein